MIKEKFKYDLRERAGLGTRFVKRKAKNIDLEVKVNVLAPRC